MSIYTKMHEAITALSGYCEVILVGVNEATGSSRWRIPKTITSVLRFDALAELGSDIHRAVIHNHDGIATFFEVNTIEEPPAQWIRGISTLQPESNAQNLRSGSHRDREFISAHRVLRPMRLTPVRELGTPGIPKFFILDIEGMDYDVALDLLSRSDVIGIGCEHALMSNDEIILLRCAAVERGFRFVFGDEDAIFLRDTV